MNLAFLTAVASTRVFPLNPQQSSGGTGTAYDGGSSNSVDSGTALDGGSSNSVDSGTAVDGGTSNT